MWNTSANSRLANLELAQLFHICVGKKKNDSHLILMIIYKCMGHVET